ncbi:hypothetical protein [Flavobacterium collinsii]|nr:hypothetical protein [Flavobacterium collinsii]
MEFLKKQIELLKQDYLNNKSLTENELFFLLEDIMDTVISQGKFANTSQDFYNYKNYSQVKIMVLDSGLGIPKILVPKIKKILPIERRFIEKESKTKIYLGSFMILFSAGCYFLFQNEFGKAPILFVISVFLFGLFFLFSGINTIRILKNSNS